MTEQYFAQFRQGVIGTDVRIPTPEGLKPMVYADWTASGRNYLPIEQRIQNDIMPLVANTHTETSTTGMAMTHAYHKAQHIIKQHLNASEEDVIITATSGMTRLINKLQRILGIRTHESQCIELPPENERPVVFITHMEHHSNQTSWLETITTVEIINPTKEGLVDVGHLEELLEKYQHRLIKIASVTACSNVTGIQTPYHQIAQKMHQAKGYCVVDFACSAPYVEIDMHPEAEKYGEGAHLDAVIFSPHKFLGGPGSAAVLVFNKCLYKKFIPDNPGGGTVDWTNPWGDHKYVDNIEAKEDGGTPAFLQTIKTAMCIKLKEEMGVENMLAREHELMDILWQKLEEIPNVHILASQHKERLAVFSFQIDNLHYHLGTKLLNDKFGLQVRGGCACAGTYGHYLLNIDQEKSNEIMDKIYQGDFSTKPGWIRVSLHPTMTNEEVAFIADCIVSLAENFKEWNQDYAYDAQCNELTSQHFVIDNAIKAQMDAALEDLFVTNEIVITRQSIADYPAHSAPMSAAPHSLIFEG